MEDGQTCQHSNNRLKQHKYNCKNIDRTAPTAHHLITGHGFNFEDTDILVTGTNYYKRLIRDMIYIKVIK